MLALDVARIEAGLLLIDTDFVSVRRALTASRIYTPFEMSLDRLVDLTKDRFVGRGAFTEFFGFNLESTEFQLSMWDQSARRVALADQVGRRRR